ncbi:NrfD/PsrC family molybdoenzyme membrane anchor subunit [Arabiibacter massiliensis]|uniref:NrfD/PsrC family molybdoenzyme membrane anchor subunit n=1 Tax=Arabiibacter massiliensis TaxID=1870985 RepID=UPI0009BA93A3|nr:NrfD/PsrC family molybdoenzyme membrane anchor subunit [Arabiibacter massiliensis]
MFGPLIVIYLFLAGAGSGAFVAAVLLSRRARSSAALAASLRRVALPALVASCGLVAVGAACLMLDLGRPELALSVLANPAGSVLSAGAWALVAFVALAAALAACNLGALRLGRGGVAAVKGLGCAAALVVMVYSGLFLSTIDTLPFLASPLVPALFVLSSLSCGGGVLLALPLLADAPARPIFREVARVDAALLALEALALGALVALAAADPLSSAAAGRLLAGDLAPAFWGGLVAAGIAAPFALEAALRAPDARASAAVGALLLVGGFFLRLCLCAAPFAGLSSYL